MSGAVTINLHGLPQVRNAMKVLQKKGLVAVARALYREGEEIMGESKLPHNVPVRDAVLQSSGHVNPPVIAGSEVRVTLGYGGPAKAYAAVQHERLDFRHPSGGRAKYLEIPAMQRAAVMGQIVAQELAVELAKAAARTKSKRPRPGR